MGTSKFLIVSNRLPVNVTKVNGEITFSPSSGGLATAMSSLGDKTAEQVWIGWPGIANDDLTPADRVLIKRKLREYGCYPVFLTRAQVKNFYEGYANDTIWPLFHYFQSVAQYSDEYWAAYKEVNALFKRAVAKQAASDASIWIHDYHLMILPAMLRTAMPQASIGFFLHIPFPSFEIFRLLPNRREILEGLLGADLIGFHIYDYARHFLSSVLRLLGYENQHGSVLVGDRVVRADVFPIGIDYQKFVAKLRDPEVEREINVLDEHYGSNKLILSMDRLDYSKGILHRLEAFEMFLKDNPKYHKKVNFIMIAVPSRTEVDAYKELREAVEHAVSRINGTYTTVDWTPISYQFKNLPFDQILALYARSDMALVTPLRDGMNLVAKEYIAAKQKRNGVLILSEMAGAIDELPEALRINPNDKRSVAQAIRSALVMSQKEQRQRLRSMQRRLSNYSVQRWAEDFMEQLSLAKRTQAEQHTKLVTSDDRQGICQAFQSAPKRLLCFDYDGTLRDYVTSPDPRQAAPPRQLLSTLRALCALPNTTVCIASGRPRKALELWFGKMPMVLVAEHGAWVKDAGSWKQAEADFQRHKKVLFPILERHAERTPGAQVEEKTFSLVWHYRNVPAELAYARNASLRHELNHALANTDIEVFSGNKILEIKPHTIHKGHVVRSLLENHPSEFVLAIGDDYTDENMFEALVDGAYTIKVGLGETHARYQLQSVQVVTDLLRKLATLKVAG
jgi:trehalose 6-phosphate synthase/phosphatase